MFTSILLVSCFCYEISPMVAVFPESIVTAQEFIKVICTASHSKATLRWFKNRDEIMSNHNYLVRVFSPSMVVLEVKVNDDTVGTYTCRDVVFDEERTFTLNTHKPSVGIMDCGSRSVNLHENVYLPCHGVSGNPSMLTVWEKEDDLVRESSRIHFDLFGLKIVNTTFEDGGVYRVSFVVSGFTLKSVAIRLDVLYKPVIEFDSHLLRIGTNDHIICQVKTNQEVEVMIIDDNDVSVSSQETDVTLREYYKIMTANLTVFDVQPDRLYRYTCMAHGDDIYHYVRNVFSTADIPQEMNLEVHGSLLTWRAPISYGTELQQYIVQILPVNSSDGKNFSVDPHQTQIDIAYNVMTPGFYRVTTWAVNQIGHSPPSQTVVDVKETGPKLSKSIALYVGGSVVGFVVILVLVLFAVFKYKNRRKLSVRPNTV